MYGLPSPLLFLLAPLLLLLMPTHAKLPCEYLSMIAGNLVLEPGTRLCLGDCPMATSAPGIYIGTDQNLFFANFILQTNGPLLTLARQDGTAVLTCDQKSCFASTRPANADTLDPGFYLTGRSGLAPVALNDPWQTSSTIDLLDGSSFQQISLQGNSLVTGWRLVVGGTSYAMTNRNQLVVGNVLVSTILNNPGYSVLAEGPVLVRNAHQACPLPIPRPTTATALLIYSSFDKPNCNLTLDPKAFYYPVPLLTCLASPLNQPNSPMAYPYFMANSTQIQFYMDAFCLVSAISASQPYVATCARGWSVILFPPHPAMAT